MKVGSVRRMRKRCVLCPRRGWWVGYLQFGLCLKKKKALLLGFARPFAGLAGWIARPWLIAGGG